MVTMIMATHTIQRGTVLVLPALATGASLAGFGDVIVVVGHPILTLLFVLTGFAIVTYPMHNSMAILKPVGLATLSLLIIPLVIQPLEVITVSHKSKTMALIFLGSAVLLLLLATKTGRLLIQPVIGFFKAVFQFLILNPARKKGIMFTLWFVLIFLALVASGSLFFFKSNELIAATVVLWILVFVVRFLFGRFRVSFWHVSRRTLPGRKRRRQR